MDTCIFVGALKHKPSLGVAKRYAEAYGMRLRTIPRFEPLYHCYGLIKDAGFAIIWNGQQGTDALVAEYCRAKHIPHVFMELGILPQNGSFVFDRDGFCGRSNIWKMNPPQEGVDRMLEARAKVQQQYPRRNEGYVLVPLQVPMDTQMYYHWDGRTLQDVVDRTRAMFPDDKIVYRPHPKVQNVSDLRIPKGCRIESKGEFLEQAAGAKVVVGVTSTCLYEAALLEVPTIAIGDHPLKKTDDHDRVLANLYAHRIDADEPEPWRVIERLGLVPAGRTPRSLELAEAC